MRNVTINYAKSWLMGIDPVATGRQLKKLRRDHGITQEFLSELFERCGDSASRVIISMWETGKKLPSLSHVVFLAELYGCSLDELIVSHRRSREVGNDDQLVPFLFMGFILLRVLEFFVFRKMEMPETKNHLLCRWRQSIVQKNHLSVTIELFRHYCKKGKVILWRIRIMI